MIRRDEAEKQCGFIAGSLRIEPFEEGARVCGGRGQLWQCAAMGFESDSGFGESMKVRGEA